MNQTPEQVPPAVTVDIYDQMYHLRGTDAAYLERLAGSVDAKMRAVAASGTTVDTLRVAVLAALNLADELARANARYERLAGSLEESHTVVRNRADSLSDMLDSVLEERRAG